ncbi:peptidylprolyl isomerase [Mesorhizobium sp. LjNodule214]|uniref:peptidylprolyl isomerase n=1 Tax=Mesorhizobium sp. LjNodule214 TaxID=3342252 RepID=UPI003ECC9608
MLKRLLREPLAHFIILALAIFAVYGLLNRGGAQAPDRIIVTAPKIEQLTEVFGKTWQRPPTVEEFKGLVDDYVKEEINVREALALGLDKDDAVIRRRLSLKMGFMNASFVDAQSPASGELDAYLKAHPTKFEIEPMLAFEQVFVNPDQHGDKTGQDAASILNTLTENPATDPTMLGDVSLLPAELPLTTKSSIGQTFGTDFAEALDKATPGQWTGPITSSFGLHVIKLSERRPGRLPALDEVRDDVAREWANDKRKEFEEHRLEELLKRYAVTIEYPAKSGATP